MELEFVDMHTAGEPVRIITAGSPQPLGPSILDKRQWFRRNADWVRRLAMWEPRGHFDMYGVLLVEPDDPDADAAVLFMHNEGYSTMCGHATIALGRWLVETGRVPHHHFRLQVPGGVVDVRYDEDGSTSYRSMPSFSAGGFDIAVNGRRVAGDVAFGGAFYALVTAESLGVALEDISLIAASASDITEHLRDSELLHHPSDARLGYLYGTIVTDGQDGKNQPSTNVCVFADRQIDRSPTGSGVQARMAAAFARGDVALGEPRTFAGVSGAEFSGTIVHEVGDGVVVEVSGRAHHMGRGVLVREPDDSLEPFLVPR